MLTEQHKKVIITAAVCDVCGQPHHAIEGHDSATNLSALRAEGWFFTVCTLWHEEHRTCTITICPKCSAKPRGGWWFVDLVTKLEKGRDYCATAAINSR